jgi:hypothetical protein
LLFVEWIGVLRVPVLKATGFEVGEPAEVYRERVADDDETDSGTAEQKLAMRRESVNREHDRIGSDRFWEIIYEGFRKAGYTTAQLRHLLGMEINPK